MSCDLFPFVLNRKSGSGNKSRRVPAGCVFFFSRTYQVSGSCLYWQSCENPADIAFFSLKYLRYIKAVVVGEGFVIATKPSAEGVSVCGWGVKPPPNVKKR